MTWRRSGSRGPWRALLALGVLLGVLGAGGCGAGGPPERIVLVVIDTLRADHVGAYGAPPHATPRIDALAARGAAVRGFLAAYHQTSMSMASLFTGRTPSLESGDPAGPLPWTGATWCGLARLAPPDGAGACIPAGVETLADAMRTAGYWTIAVPSNDFLYEPSGFGRGFDDVEEVGEPPETPDREREPLPAERAWRTRTRDRVHAGAVRALARRPHDRLFLYVHYMDVHDFGYRGRPYAEAVADADAAVGTLLAHLRAIGLLEDAVVVVTSDHGEHLGETHPPHPERRRRSHLGNPSYEELLRIPLVVAPVPAEGLPTLRRTQDLHRWLRTLAGAPPAPDDETRPGELYLSERRYRTYRGERFKSAFPRGPGRTLLFDLAADPHEQRDVSNARPEVLDAHRTRVDGLARALAARPPAQAAPSEDDRRRLRSLGYLE